MSLKIKKGVLEASEVNSIGSNAEKNVCSYLVTGIQGQSLTTDIHRKGSEVLISEEVIYIRIGLTTK
jgi:hypothetical protein